MNAALNTYLQTGGIPDALKYPELPLLRTLYDDVLYRDIATRYRIDAVTALKELAFYLISNPASPHFFQQAERSATAGQCQYHQQLYRVHGKQLADLYPELV